MPLLRICMAAVLRAAFVSERRAHTEVLSISDVPEEVFYDQRLGRF